MGEKEESAVSSTEPDVDLPQASIPDDAIDLSEEKNGAVFKVIKTAGQGDARPSIGDSCTVHYVGSLTDGTNFDSSRDRGEPFSFNIGRSQVIKGWDLAVATMAKGELCDVIVKPEFAYGEAGSPPRIPANATLIFEIELISWEGEDISPDRDKTITRSIQQQGDKHEYPNDGAQVTAHVIGWYEGKEFRNEQVSFVLGEATELCLPEGIDKALKRFRMGERSSVHFKARWGYGRHGNQQYGIPANAELDFELLLIDFERANESWQMNKEEKLAEAEKMKVRGAEFFQQGKNKLAAVKYKRILDLLQHESRYEGVDKEKRDTIFLAAHNNLAMIFLRTGETVEAIKHCNKVLEENQKNVKALYRRAQAYQNQNDFEDAIKDFHKVLVLEPANKAAQANILKCQNGIAEVKKHQKVVFANIFDKLAKSSPTVEPPAKETEKGEEEPAAV